MKRRMALLCAAAALTGSASAEGSIGVIGGADGPTVIFVTAGDGWWIGMLIALIVIAAGIWLIVRGLKRRKR